MAQHVWTIICKKASIDKETNVISFFEVLEALQFTGPDMTKKSGALPFPVEIVTLWSRTEVARAERATGRVRLRFPDGSEVEGTQLDVNLTEHARLRTFVQMQAFPLKGAGIYDFHIDLRDDDRGRWETVARIPLVVTLTDGPAAPPTTPATVQ
jgi:hypothetical protein